DLIVKLHEMVEHGLAAMSAAVSPAVVAPAPAPAAAPAIAEGTLVPQILERELRPGEVSLDELERAFQETAIEVTPAPALAPVAEREADPAPAVAKKEAKAVKKPAVDAEVVAEGDKVANQSIRVNVDTLQHLMTMVSELVLTRDQLLETSRRNEDTELKAPL